MTEEEIASSRCLWVGNLPFEVSPEDVKHFFSSVPGLVKLQLSRKNRQSNQSKGHAFAEYDSHEHAMEAFKTFNQASFHGRTIRVDWDLGIDQKVNRGILRDDDIPRPRGPGEPSPGSGRLSMDRPESVPASTSNHPPSDTKGSVVDGSSWTGNAQSSNSGAPADPSSSASPKSASA